MSKNLLLIVFCFVLSSCASMPHLDYSYPTGGQLSSHVLTGYGDDGVEVKANLECKKYNKNAEAVNLIKRYEGGIGKIFGEGGEYDIWIYDCKIRDKEQTKVNDSKKNSNPKENMIQALKSIPGVADAGWPQEISLWVFMSNPNAGHDFDQMGYLICNGGVTNFGVSKGYSITFWNLYTKKELSKFRCF